MIPSDAGLVVFFLVGFFGGAHCLGMCGPLVTMYAERFESDGRGPTTSALRQHLLFNAGRTASYTVIGAFLGLLGGLLFDAGALVSAANGVRGVVGIFVGTFIVAAGIGYITRGQPRFTAGSIPGVGGLFATVSGSLHARIDDWAAGPGIVGLGAIHGLLPCPLLYPAFLYAAASGSPIHGGLALAALGLGTVPALFVYGTVLDTASPTVRGRLHRALGVVFVVAGTIPLAKGLGALGYAVPHVPLPMPPMMG
ncbi:hypothetical protein L593_03605 [Salinarchaeum sp. Harcht-Bsk1]|uniref:sulfite exporter TauE/SafE family protein n=1 Tax=Salinarchaeum sp. Harcht-Bsk1 TaxID=1333523 RepID=UPI000342353C|nr:sulfite exporter TauE/SafE family protein [Salinarchaeum sp. Harcht-Bsk1]AGN00672.1 hypothetical protein L593_03605 [Salinarchaeum sp. Harcht-Bsk1]